MPIGTKEQVRKWNQAYYKRNGEAYKERARKRYKLRMQNSEFKESEKKRKREWRRKYLFEKPEKVSQYNKKSKNKKLRFLILKRDDFTCQYCGRSAPGVVLHIDHVFPKSKGGKNSIDNLVTACMDCNLGKSDVLLIKT